MNAVSFGPLVMDGSRFSVILAMFVFLVGTGILSKKIDERFNNWAWVTLIFTLIGARAGHVILNWASFSQEPMRIFSVWQGGFYWLGALIGLAFSFLFVLKNYKQCLWALTPVLAALFVWNSTNMLTNPTQALSAPEQVFEAYQGEGFSLASAKGRPQIVNLWASWCPPCRREMPMMAEMAASNDAVDFVFANQGEGRAAIRKYLSSEELELPRLLMDQFSDLSRHYGAPGLPATLFIGADGVLKNAHLGEISREVLQEKIDRLVDDQ